MSELASASDVVTLHVPLTEETHHLVDDAFLDRVRPGTILINCGRGGLVDLDAAFAALESGRLAGVGLDVFDPEPPEHHPLFDHPDVVLTPHLMGMTRRAAAATFVDAARGIVDVLAGRRPAAVANPEWLDAVRGGAAHDDRADQPSRAQDRRRTNLLGCVRGAGMGLPACVLIECSRRCVRWAYVATELGPEGFLPSEPAAMAGVLSEHGLQAVGGFTPLLLHVAGHDPVPEVDRILDGYVASGAQVLVLSAVTGSAGYDNAATAR